jgi:hypothetical protein
MQLINALFTADVSHIGRLAVKNSLDEDATVYVVWDVNEKSGLVRLVELDRPADGENHLVDYNIETIYLLEPLDVLERVIEFK